MPTLNWIGKEKVINHHQDVPYRILEKQYTYADGKEDNAITSENKIIHGDNLEALKSLLPEYEGKIKCIYIDPPYNTGKEQWIYSDNVNSPKINKWLGEVVGKEGEDLTRHDKWLCMMYPRLKLLHRLLADDGVIFISIDDNAQAFLKLLCDEIFGSNNFLNNVVWQRSYSPINLKKRFSLSHDFIVCYAKRLTDVELSLPRSAAADKRYKNPDKDSRGVWKSSDLSVGPAIKEKVYEIISPSGRSVFPPDGYCWRYSKERFEELKADNRIWFGKNGNNVPSIKRFASEVKDGITPMTFWTYQEVGHNQDAKKEIKEIFLNDKKPFDTPKPMKLMQRLLQLQDDKNALILDSFAGSGTTAHAVLNLNKEDGGNRKFILIEMEDYANDITAERVKRVIKGYGKDKKAVEGTGGDFAYYELGEPIFLENELLNEAIGKAKIEEYVWYSETKTKYEVQEETYFLGALQDTAYYFYYEKERLTTLDESYLRTLKTKAKQYIIYADLCLLDKALMDKYHIVFKKIPRDITRF